MSLSQLKIIHSSPEMDTFFDPLHLVCYVLSQSDYEFVKMRLSPRTKPFYTSQVQSKFHGFSPYSNI